jgi:hypothetical protein
MSSDHLFRRKRKGKPSGPWIAWGYDAAGKRWQESTRCRDKRAAEAKYRELERLHASTSHAAATTTLAEAVTRFLAGLATQVERKKRSASTLSRSPCTLRRRASLPHTRSRPAMAAHALPGHRACLGHRGLRGPRVDRARCSRRGRPGEKSTAHGRPNRPHRTRYTIDAIRLRPPPFVSTLRP